MNIKNYALVTLGSLLLSQSSSCQEEQKIMSHQDSLSHMMNYIENKFFQEEYREKVAEYKKLHMDLLPERAHLTGDSGDYLLQYTNELRRSPKKLSIVAFSDDKSKSIIFFDDKVNGSVDEVYFQYFDEQGYAQSKNYTVTETHQQVFESVVQEIYRSTYIKKDFSFYSFTENEYVQWKPTATIRQLLSEYQIKE